MALLKGTNSYVTTAEADAYFLDRIDVADWSAATPEVKDRALVTATTILENIAWAGSVVSDTQSLAFPRSGHYFDPRLGSNTSFDEETVPDRIVKATMELAYHLILNDGLLDSEGSVKDLTVGGSQSGIVLKSIRKPSILPPMVNNLIQPIRVNNGANSWWRSN